MKNLASFVSHLFCCSLLLGCGGAMVEPTSVGDTAPGFQLTEVSSQEQFGSSALKGDVVVLSFWSTTCANCLKEIEELKAIQAEGNARVIGIAIDDDVPRVNAIVQAKEINYTVLNGNEDVFVRYDGFSIPYTLVLDSNLTIRKKIHGRIEKAAFDELIESLKNNEP